MGAHQTMKKNNGRQIPSWNAPCTLLLSVIMEEIRVCAKPAPWPKTQSTERQTLSLNSMIAIPIESSNYLEVRGGGVESGGGGVDFTDGFQDEPERSQMGLNPCCWDVVWLACISFEAVYQQLSHWTSEQHDTQ